MFVKESDEGSTVEYAAVLTDQRPSSLYAALPGTPIPLTGIVTLDLVKLYDGEACLEPPESIVLIDGREDIALIAGGVVQPPVAGLGCTYDEARLDPVDPTALLVPWLRVLFPPECQVITRPTTPIGGYELHVATFRIEHTAGVRHWEIGIRVKNLGGI